MRSNFGFKDNEGFDLPDNLLIAQISQNPEFGVRSIVNDILDETKINSYADLLILLNSLDNLVEGEYGDISRLFKLEFVAKFGEITTINRKKGFFYQLSNYNIRNTAPFVLCVKYYSSQHCDLLRNIFHNRIHWIQFSR